MRVRSFLVIPPFFASSFSNDDRHSYDGERPSDLSRKYMKMKFKATIRTGEALEAG